MDNIDLIPQIESGEKYAIVALPGLALDWSKLPMGMQVGPSLWFAQKLPFKLDQNWRDWIGSLRTEHLAEAQLILLAKSAAGTPGVLDGENQRLVELVGRFYQGLQLATSLWVSGEVVMLTGESRDGAVGVRQMSTLVRLGYIHEGRSELIGAEALQLAARFVPVLGGFTQGKYRRLVRVVNAYFSGIAQNDWRERLHQFCRCVEGLIFAEQGQTTKQFRSRTELFIGPRYHEFMGDLYETRSAVEHMNDPVLAGKSESEQTRSLFEMTLVAESVARYCLSNILLKPELLLQYLDETTLGAFWSTNKADRMALWGPPLELAKVRKGLQERLSNLRPIA